MQSTWQSILKCNLINSRLWLLMMWTEVDNENAFQKEWMQAFGE